MDDSAGGGLLNRIKATSQLPTPPGVVVRLLELTKRPEVSAREIANTVAMDPGLSAKILRFVNSPLAGLSREVSSLSQAVALMGVRGVKMMSLSFSVICRKGEGFCKGFDHGGYIVHSFGCAIAAQKLAQETLEDSQQEAFVAGLLSQIGRSILASALPEEYEQVLARAKTVPVDLPPIERELLGGDYAAIGGQVLQEWGLPEQLWSAIEVFRDPEKSADVPLAQVLQAAELIATVICHAPKDALELETVVDTVAETLGIPDDRTAVLVTEIATELHAARATFELPTGKTRPIPELEAELRDRITELGVAMHLENQTMAEQQHELMKRATTDALTGIGNRASFDARLSLEVERAARCSTPIALLMMDVDRFKRVNDTHGHLAGDHVLRTIAQFLDENVRKIDYCARYGGEEFAVIAPTTPIEGVLHVAERLRSGIADLVVEFDGKTIPVSISIGVGFLEHVGDAPNASKEIVRIADELLYDAKCNGRNRVSSAIKPVHAA